MEKEFKSYIEQIKVLQSKGLIVSDTEHTIQLLKHIGYFALINGYKKPFKQDNGRYIQEAKLEDIEQLYLFDEQLRTLMLERLLLIERRVKSSIAYNFSNTFRGVNEYFNINNYEYNKSKIFNIQEINKLISVMINIYNDNKHPYIIHYKTKHNGDIPLWVIINAMTFGQVSKMYSLLQMRIQQKVSGDFNMHSNKDFGKMLNMITLFRNVCAHNERLYDYTVQSGVEKKYIKISPQDKNLSYDRERKKFFGLLVCCNCLIEGQERLRLFNGLTKLIDRSPILNNPNIKDVILREMGLPNNWKELLGIE